MKIRLSKISLALKKPRTQQFICGATLAAMLASPAALAQEKQKDDVSQLEVIEVSGIRSALTSALAEKRDASSLVEIINSEDIGKLPDQNLAEVLENVTGIQITRSAGVGTGVQIRGSNANRVEINGVSTVGSGSGRNGLSFEDINPAIISSVEVIKAPEASTIEGSVGGTINLRTIRPLDLTETLGVVRVQGEDSSLSTEGIQPRFSIAYGENWEVDAGDVGFVITGSYTEQEAVSFRPRTDRDNLVTAIEGQDPFQGIQFLVQEQENDDYETLNIATTFEFAPNDEMRFYFDAIINEQERSRDNYRLQASGISNVRNFSTPTAFETINYGNVNGTNVGTFRAALAGELEPILDQRSGSNPSDGNLRFSSETGARVTDSSVFVFGGEWERDNFKVSAEISSSSADTTNPSLDTTVNFINPNAPLVVEVRNADGSRIGRVPLMGDITSEAEAIASLEGGASGFTYNDNAVPFIYDLSGGSLSWGINFDSPLAPTQADLLNPNNVVLDQVNIGRNSTENQEDAFRVDGTYYFEDIEYITSVDVGFRLNKSTSVFEDIDGRIGGFSRMADSPNGSLFSDLLVAGPSNFGDADGRSLFVDSFLLLDPDRSFSDPEGTLATLQAAVIAHDPDSPSIANITSNSNAFRDIEETTTALYAQANFEIGENIRGNFGVRYVSTDVDSTGFNPEDMLETSSGDYSFVLPRLNLIYTPHDDVTVRFGYGTDIRRPDFGQLGTGFTRDNQENSVIALGNPGLEPEEVDSLDLSVDWYFAEAAVVSVGYFRKERTNIFGVDFEGAALSPNGEGGFNRETDPTCPGGGIFNPEVVPNVLGNPDVTGLCVDITTPGNDPDTTTQTGFEFAAQYDLSSYEDDLGWASGFGVIANYTIQDFSGGSVVDSTSGRGLTVLGDVSIPRGLLDFSENAYNFTLYYEKYGVSARMRYTWREAFRTNDFAGGANTSGSSTLSFPVVTDDRGQLNASITYDVNEKLNIGLEAVNLTEERIDQYCVSNNSLLCFVGLPDRRITFGATYRF